MADPTKAVAHVKEASAEAVRREQGARAQAQEQQSRRCQGEEGEGLSHGAPPAVTQTPRQALQQRAEWARYRDSAQ